MSGTTTPSHVRGKPQSLALPVLGIVLAVLMIVVGALLAGNRDGQLPTAYGRRRGLDAARSVNGTLVLAELFKRAGHRVTSLGRFSPRLKTDFDIVVWIPNDFGPPTKEQREFLEEWLAGGQGRTVVYVGRDYDAAVAYWDRMAPQAPPAQADEALRRHAEARAAHEAARSKMPHEQYARWFTARRDEKPRAVKQLTGEWAEGIDAAQTEIHLEGRLAIPCLDEATGAEPLPKRFDVLLGTGRDALVFEVTNEPEQNVGRAIELTNEPDWNGGKVIVVANGSLVLNYPLINHEHRKLAAKLVAECGQPGRVVFIESGPGGPPVLDKEPAGGPHTPLDLLKVWPLNAILLHLTILGIIFCLARSPIFGRPRELPVDSPADFGKHVAALGQLLARTKDRHYAQARVAQYRQIAERKSGRSHRKPK